MSSSNDSLNNATQVIDNLDCLLSSRLTPIIDQFPNGSATVQRCLAQNADFFKEKIKSLGTNAPKQALMEKVLRIEENLNLSGKWRLDTEIGIVSAIECLIAHASREIRPFGVFLSLGTAERILRENPPQAYLALVHSCSLPHHDALEILALTRHTEPSEWQDLYHRQLISLTPHNFEERPIRFLTVDSTIYRPVLDASGQKEKPWRISHSKETGTIHCFTIEQSSLVPAPILQFASVFYHYLFETIAAGQFTAFHASKHPEILGTFLVEAMISNRHRFDFFHPNAYSEHLFWEQALALLVQAFPSPELQFFDGTIGCGGFFNGNRKNIVSLNLIDHIWNVNLPKQPAAREYFGTITSSFLYHFREGLWYDLFKELCGISTSAMRKELIENLHLGDIPFTDMLARSSLS